MWKTIYLALKRKPVRKAGLSCCRTVIRDFFLFQYRAKMYPKRIPVSQSDHPLDELIPFNPRWVRIYLSFIAFWIQIVGFILVRYGERGTEPAIRFAKSIEELYLLAVKVYRKNLSTTRRPRYLATARFLMIHTVDPHLMCIPSLHVMIAVRTYTGFRQLLKDMGETSLGGEAEKIRRGALDITQAVLYVKQHSVNCISAALYAMSRHYPELFPPEEAAAFVGDLFPAEAGPPSASGFASSAKLSEKAGDEPMGPFTAPEDGRKIREHIISLYRSFLDEKDPLWAGPLLRYLKKLPPA
jgi:hypothetical protein